MRAAASPVPAVATEGAFAWQAAEFAAAPFVQVLLQEAFWACAPTIMKEKKHKEKRIFFIGCIFYYSCYKW
jgi:hypothetical protein